MNKNKWFLNGGRGSGRAIRLLCETYENKIAELEKENAELKQAKEGKVVEHFEAYGQCRDSRRIAELEAENAELKTDYEVLSCSVGDFGELQDKLEEEQRNNNGLSDNLTKAKKIIKALLRLWNDVMTEETVKALIAEAEQFLSEVEK